MEIGKVIGKKILSIKIDASEVSDTDRAPGRRKAST